MGLMNEYIKKGWSAVDIENELMRLVKLYEQKQGAKIFVFASAIGKPHPEIPLCMDDYYIIYDMLKDSNQRNLDFYIETPGGSGEAAEEIAGFLHDHFETVRFVISGEAKSAGTILALSGHDILMTKSGSLGPIDAQVRIGRSIVSAYDYMDWINEKRTEALKKGTINPIDATIVAQISPGEVKLVDHAKNFALDLVKGWLPKYKFGSWVTTETRGIPVTETMKNDAALRVATKLVNHADWRTHGRSIKSKDLEEIGLRVTNLDEDSVVADIVYRIQTVTRLLFASTTQYKVFVCADQKIFKSAAPMKTQTVLPTQSTQPGVPDVIQIQVDCPQCGTTHKLYAKFKQIKVDKQLKQAGFIPVPTDRKLACMCGYEIDLHGIVNDIESKAAKKIIKE